MPTKLISIRIGTELLDYLQKRAMKEHRTLSNMIIAILSEEAEPVRHGNRDCGAKMDGGAR